MNEVADFEGTGSESIPITTRTITLNINDYISLEDLQTVAVYIDSIYKGLTDVNGDITITSITVGGHTIKMTKTGYINSDLDDLYNDFIMVI